MIINPFKVFLFVAGGSAAAATTAYVSGALDPYLQAAPPAQIAALPQDPAKPDPAQPPAATPPAAETPPAATPPAEPPPATADAPAAPPAAPPPAQPPATAEAPAQPPATEPAPPPATPPVAAAPAAEPPQDIAAAEPTPPPPPAAKPEVIAPSFDLVRVEANGSIVIAGKAAPNAKVEAITGSRVIGSADAGPEGDFAIILDEPLKPGDYQIVLRSVAPGNIVAMSIETAIVSIPTDAGGQVLAMVEEPGKPAELITVPQPEAPKPAEPVPPATAEQPTPPAEQPPAVAAPADQPPASDPATPAPAAEPKVVVEAVEIEGKKIFVAGSADPGRLVRAYANEILLGDAKTSEGGRFLIEAERDLPVGDYIIRVDALEPGGEKVVARAAVPFEREPGEAIAAVAPPATVPAPAEPATPPQTEIAAADPAKPADPAPAEAQPPAMQPPAAAETTPPVVQPPAAAEAVPPEPEPKPDVPADVAAAPPAENPPAANPPATSEPPAVANAPQPPATEPPAAQPPAAADAAPPAATPPAAAEATPPATEPKPEAPADVAVAPPAEQPPETTAPKLQPSASGVIIRRGDNLWRISRRVYGLGTRYSTLYLANQDQIRDPDMIWPGQVFKVPETSKEGEAADMKAMGDQMTPMQ